MHIAHTYIYNIYHTPVGNTIGKNWSQRFEYTYIIIMYLLLTDEKKYTSVITPVYGYTL